MTETTLEAATSVVRREDVLAERLLDETVILDPDSDRYTRLNLTGGRLWTDLAAPRTLEALANRLSAEFGIDERSALADVTAFVGDLMERTLVEVVGATSGGQVD